MSKYCIAITGPIGSGKSAISACFASLGIEIINADNITKELTIPNTEAYTKIVQKFGDVILNKDKTLNRAKLRELVFKDTHKKKFLEKLLHPLIRYELETRAKGAKSAYCILEIPLLFEKINFPYINKILVVLANNETRILRIMQRDNITKQQAEDIINTQATIEQYRAIADDEVDNNGELNEIMPKVLELHEKYKALATSSIY